MGHDDPIPQSVHSWSSKDGCHLYYSFERLKARLSFSCTRARSGSDDDGKQSDGQHSGEVGLQSSGEDVSRCFQQWAKVMRGESEGTS